MVARLYYKRISQENLTPCVSLQEYDASVQELEDLQNEKKV